MNCSYKSIWLRNKLIIAGFISVVLLNMLQANINQEQKLQIVTDKSFYFTGEIMWLYTSIPENNPTQSKELITVEYYFLNPDGVTVHSGAIACNKSHHSYNLTVPYSLKSEFYRIIFCVADYDSGLFYYNQHVIPIINSLKRSEELQFENIAQRDSREGDHYNMTGKQEKSVCGLELVTDKNKLLPRSSDTVSMQVLFSDGKPYQGRLVIWICDSIRLINTQRSNKTCDDSVISGGYGTIEFKKFNQNKIVYVPLCMDEAGSYYYKYGKISVPADKEKYSIYISSLENPNCIFHTDIYSDTLIKLKLPDFYENNNLIIKLENRFNNYICTFNALSCSRFISEIPGLSLPSNKALILDYLQTLYLDRNAIINLYNLWDINVVSNKLVNVSEKNQQTQPFYGEPTLRFKPDQYKEAENFSRFVMQYLPYIQIKEKRNQSTIVVSPLYRNNLSESKFPSVFLNGVHISNPEMLKTIPTGNIENIDLKFGRVFHNGNFYEGILAIYLKEGINPMQYFNSNVTMVRLSSFEKQYQFESNQYPEYPDMRDLLYWNTAIKTDSTGKVNLDIKTSDISGSYYIRAIAGDDKNGVITGSKLISVDYD